MPSNISKMSSVPLEFSGNRDEHIIVDVGGCWIPWCDVIIYGLLNSEYANDFYKLQHLSMKNVDEIYREYSAFAPIHLIQYLASPTEEFANISVDDAFEYLNTAVDRYLYTVCHETVMRYSLISLAYQKFVKDITLVYPWQIREVDKIFNRKIIPPEVIDKFFLIDDMTLKDAVGHRAIIEDKSNISYTTIVSTSLDDTREMVHYSKEYKTSETAFLLQNSTENTTFTNTKSGGNIELGSHEIYAEMTDSQTGIPINGQRFARFYPILRADINIESPVGLEELITDPEDNT